MSGKGGIGETSLMARTDADMLALRSPAPASGHHRPPAILVIIAARIALKLSERLQNSRKSHLWPGDAAAARKSPHARHMSLISTYLRTSLSG
jgi:hypothetical protein